MHKAWKKHQNTVYWVDINLAQKKGLKFYQTLSNAIVLYETLPAYCIPKVVRMETGEVIYEKAYMSPRPSPKISLHEWKREFDSEVARQPEEEVARQPEGEVARQPEGEVSRQAKFFQPAQTLPNPIRERSGRLDNMQDGRKHVPFSGDQGSFNSSERMHGRFVETVVIQTGSSEDKESQC